MVTLHLLLLYVSPSTLTIVSKGNGAQESPQIGILHIGSDLLLPKVWVCCLVTRRVWLGL